jgi:hypothetical protein
MFKILSLSLITMMALSDWEYCIVAKKFNTNVGASNNETLPENESGTSSEPDADDEEDIVVSAIDSETSRIVIGVIKFVYLVIILVLGIRSCILSQRKSKMRSNHHIDNRLSFAV